MKMRMNKTIENIIENIRNNEYTEEIITVSNVELLLENKRKIVSVYQGDYPVFIKFTPMQKVEVTYRNKYFGIQKDIVLMGYDAVRYKECLNGAYEGEYLSEDIIAVDFVGEFATVTKTIKE